MSTTPAPNASGLQTAVNILQIVATLEPAAVQLIMAFLQKLEGKTTAEILAEANGVFASVADKARAELAVPPPTE